MKIIITLFLFILISYGDILIKKDFGELKDFKISYFYDDSSNLDINSIENKEFKDKTTSQYTFGHLDGNMWFKLNFTNRSNIDEFILYFSESFYEHLVLYEKQDGKFIQRDYGFRTPLKDREMPHSNPAFKIKIDKFETKSFYIKAKTQFEHHSEFILYPYGDNIPTHQLNMLIIYTLYFGGMIIILIFNLFLFIRLKESIYGYYTSYILWWGIFMFFYSGLNTYFGLGPWYYILHFSGSLTVLSLILFTKDFLAVQSHSILLSKILKYLSWLFMIFTILNIYDIKWFYIMIQFSFFAFIFMMFVALKIALKGDDSAKLYSIAMGVNMLSLALVSGLANGWIENNDITRYFFLFGSFFEIIFFTLLLSNRFNTLQIQKVKMQDKLLKTKQQREIELQAEVKKRTDKISNLLKEKDILLQEVYHRVKNNFQMLIALLWIQNDDIVNKAVKESITNIINRLKSMSLVHQLLYESKNLSNIDTKEYISKMVNEIKNSYKNKDIKIYEDIDPISLNMNNSLTIGMIINETINNSIKHNDTNEHLKILIRLKNEHSKVLLEIKDNGSGFKPSDIKNSFGLNIIKDFSKKLKNNQLSIINQNGTLISLSFDKE